MPRPLELALALVLALVATPVVILCALFVWVALGSPLFFRQWRAGRFRRPFLMIKFRSMSQATDQSGKLLPDRDRTGLAGHLLRRLRLDELPEVLNVLRGEMSLVGPRPLLPGTIDAMGAEGIERCAVRPGLTGWAQVNGNSMLRNEEKVALDLWYIRNRSLRLDLLILVRTVGVVLFGEKINKTSLEAADAGCPSRGC
jgi:lipopolysaccharide/colanic/teichoic acid biosynthesis glycosyltransferase